MEAFAVGGCQLRRLEEGQMIFPPHGLCERHFTAPSSACSVDPLLR